MNKVYKVYVNADMDESNFEVSSTLDKVELLMPNRITSASPGILNISGHLSY